MWARSFCFTQMAKQRLNPIQRQLLLAVLLLLLLMHLLSKTPATPSDSPVQTASTYTVKSGDSLWLIAKKFPGVSAEDIMAHNKVDANISPGQVLNIPKAQ